MKGYVSIFKDPDEIELRVRAEGHGVVGDALCVLKPGDTAFGWSYEALLMHGEGMVDLEGE